MNAILQEILEIPARANEVLNRTIEPLPLHVPYLGMGSSYFAPLAFKYLGVPIQPELASEYYYYLAKGQKKEQAVLLSQSGRSSEVLWCRNLFEQYVAVTNYADSELATSPNVAGILAIGAGQEQYSSSKTYVNTLIGLFQGFGFAPEAAVARLTRRFDEYRRQGEQLARDVFDVLQQHRIHGIYDHGPKETAQNSIIIQILTSGPIYERTQRLSVMVARAGAHVFTVEVPEDETYSILDGIIPFNFMAYHLALMLNIGETFIVGGKVTKAIE